MTMVEPVYHMTVLDVFVACTGGLSDKPTHQEDQHDQREPFRNSLPHALLCYPVSC